MASQQPCEHCGRPAKTTETRVEVSGALNPTAVAREVQRTLRALKLHRGFGPA
ncbi:MULTISPECIES: hypothetical protein [unclassified Streptomyces]|uniref:hypothetical protein n=1 Tax=unclassified Streptomyces TaxID=2593676 RepID=UPI0036F101B3